MLQRVGNLVLDLLILVFLPLCLRCVLRSMISDKIKEARIYFLILRYIHKDLCCFSADLEDNDILLIGCIPGDCCLSYGGGPFHWLLS